MGKIEFLDQQGSFRVYQPEDYSGLYFPLAGDGGLKSCITPTLGGDSKRDQNHFLMEPVSIENLHNNKNTRNFWCRIKNRGYWSACGSSAEAEFLRFTGEQEKSVLEAGFMWQKLTRTSAVHGLKAEITSFVTVDGAMEVMMTELTNITEEPLEMTPIAVMPVYGRSADNIRDHRHVTSLLHRICTTDYGVEVTPAMSFDERGHQKNHTTYFVYGSTGEGEAPAAFYPTVGEFIGEGGSYLIPEAVRTEKPGAVAGSKAEGKEAVGALKFAEILLKPHETVCYLTLGGMTDERSQIEPLTASLRQRSQVKEAYDEVKRYWTKKVNITFKTGNPDADNYLKWITFQPILRRIYGCSFLPYHDYGRGGRGWRDLWQDCLSLLILDPKEVRSMILNSFEGVRFDGTNATIIGNQPGEFVADRNNITRVWMDHAFWPFVTTKLYMNQTGDVDILNEKIPYFKDPQVCRGNAKDEIWTAEYGMRQKTEAGTVYEGTVLEHLLLQNLSAFYEAGDHGVMRLRGADWNDALDMAAEHGESVAFTCAYIGNLKDLADTLEIYRERCHVNDITIAKEMEVLISQEKDIYASAEKRNAVLAEYANKCVHNISGEQISVDIAALVKDLREKADWYTEFIKKNEWVSDGNGHGWFNGYYDNSGRQVEGVVNGNVRMMLTGQVFSIMGNVADDAEVAAIADSADTYLYKKEIGGYRLNTDFQEEKFDLGRMFGFAYGEKENGAVFSHMTVMYANALYQRGFVKEGYKALYTLLEQAMNTKVSRMYPGIPEYFDAQGRGKYPYLTGAASWYMMTVVTQIYGFRGLWGDLMIEPKILSTQFDALGNFSAEIPYRGQIFSVVYQNPEHKEYGTYKISEIWIDGTLYKEPEEKSVCIPFSVLEGKKAHTLRIVLG